MHCKSLWIKASAKCINVNVQLSLSLHPQYHDWGALEQGTEPTTAPRAPQHEHRVQDRNAFNLQLQMHNFFYIYIYIY